MLKIATVCTGIGAPEKALQLLGIPYELEFFSEIDLPAIRSYCAIHGEPRNKNFGDLTNIDRKPLPTDLDLVVGGTPCQDFSTSGLGKGGEEGSGTRSSLMWYYVRMISLAKPKLVVWENVAAVLSVKHVRTYRKFYYTLNALGYRVHAQLLNAKYYNVPQNRVRIILVGIRKDLQSDFEFPVGYDSGVRIRDVLQKTVSDKYFSKCFDDVTPYGRYYRKNAHCIQYYGRIKNTKFKQTNEVLYIDGITDFLTTKQGNYIIDDRKPREKPIRHYTPSESLRFMGFEDKDYYKCRYVYFRNKRTGKKDRHNNVSELDIYAQAGNSIVVNVLMAVFGQLYGVPWERKVFGERYKTQRQLLYELPLFTDLIEVDDEQRT